MPLATCPSCDEDVNVPGKVRLGAVIVCPRCAARLEVISTAPLELDWAFDEADELEDEEADEFGDLEEEEDEEEELEDELDLEEDGQA